MPPEMPSAGPINSSIGRIYAILREKASPIMIGGGVVSFDQPNGIDKFKMSFGGSQAIYYNIMEENSLWAKLIHGLLRLKKRS